MSSKKIKEGRGIKAKQKINSTDIKTIKYNPLQNQKLTNIHKKINNNNKQLKSNKKTTLSVKQMQTESTNLASISIQKKPIKINNLSDIQTDINNYNFIFSNRSKKISPKNTHSLFMEKILEEYAKKEYLIIRIQRYWRSYKNKKIALKQRKELKIKNKYNKIIQEIKSKEQQKWNMARQLLIKIRSGNESIDKIILKLQESKNFSQFSQIQQNLEQILNVNLITKTQSNEQKIKQELEFYLYNDNTNQQNENKRQSIQIPPQLKIEQNIVFDSSDEGNQEYQTAIQHTHIKSYYQYINYDSIFYLFFQSIQLKYKHLFQQRMKTAFGFTPIQLLLNIRNLLDDQYINRLHQAQQILPHYIFSDIYTNIIACMPNQNYQIINCVLGFINQSITKLRPFNEQGKPPLQFRNIFPSKKFEQIKYQVKNDLSDIKFINNVNGLEVKLILDEKLYFSQIQKQLYNNDHEIFEIKYEISQVIFEQIALEFIYQLLLMQHKGDLNKWKIRS